MDPDRSESFFCKVSWIWPGNSLKVTQEHSKNDQVLNRSDSRAPRKFLGAYRKWSFPWATWGLTVSYSGTRRKRYLPLSNLETHWKWPATHPKWPGTNRKWPGAHRKWSFSSSDLRTHREYLSLSDLEAHRKWPETHRKWPETYRKWAETHHK